MDCDCFLFQHFYIKVWIINQCSLQYFDYILKVLVPETMMMILMIVKRHNDNKTWVYFFQITYVNHRPLFAVRTMEEILIFIQSSGVEGFSLLYPNAMSFSWGLLVQIWAFNLSWVFLILLLNNVSLCVLYMLVTLLAFSVVYALSFGHWKFKLANYLIAFVGQNSGLTVKPTDKYLKEGDWKIAQLWMGAWHWNIVKESVY